MLKLRAPIARPKPVERAAVLNARAPEGSGLVATTFFSGARLGLRGFSSIIVITCKRVRFRVQVRVRVRVRVRIGRS